MARYADVYASTPLNLIYYPFSYMFRAPAMLVSLSQVMWYMLVLELGLFVSLFFLNLWTYAIEII